MWFGGETFYALAINTNQTPPNISYWASLTEEEQLMGIPSQSIPVLDKSTVLNLLSDLSPP